MYHILKKASRLCVPSLYFLIAFSPKCFTLKKKSKHFDLILCKYFTWSIPDLILLNLLGGRYDPGPTDEETQGKGRLSR